MSVLQPLPFVWTGEAFEPATKYTAKLCGEHFESGQRYRLVEELERSHRSHSHFFASLTEAWRNLPEGMDEDFPTPDHLRRFALIKTGFYNSERMTLDTPKDAERFAGYIKPRDEFSIVTVQGCMVTIFTAKSQSKRAMGPKEFQASKQATLEYVWSLVGISPEEGAANAGRAA